MSNKSTIKCTSRLLHSCLVFHDERLKIEREIFDKACEQFMQKNPMTKRHWIFWKRPMSPIEALEYDVDMLYGEWRCIEDKLVAHGILDKNQLQLSSVKWTCWKYKGSQRSLWRDEVREVRALLRPIDTSDWEKWATCYVSPEVANFMGKMMELKHGAKWRFKTDEIR